MYVYVFLFLMTTGVERSRLWCRTMPLEGIRSVRLFVANILSCCWPHLGSSIALNGYWELVLMCFIFEQQLCHLSNKHNLPRTFASPLVHIHIAVLAGTLGANAAWIKTRHSYLCPATVASGSGRTQEACAGGSRHCVTCLSSSMCVAVCPGNRVCVCVRDRTLALVLSLSNTFCGLAA